MTDPVHRFDSSELNKMVAYFDPQVLAAYRSEPDKYKLQTDFFEGEVTLRDDYYLALDDQGIADAENINVRFGYRTKADGTLAIAAWLPDLFERSKGHLNRWAGFRLDNPTWIDGKDRRFTMWLQRNIEGSWEVESGPSLHIPRAIARINGLTREVCASPLFVHKPEPGDIAYPSGENTHMYEDAHKQLYGLLIDGLDRDCISRLAALLGKPTEVTSSRTLHALKKLIPRLADMSEFSLPFDVISENRRKSAHGARPPAESFAAFDAFTEDLNRTLRALEILEVTLEEEFHMDAESAEMRQAAVLSLPKIARSAEAHYLIASAPKMIGKTVKSVKYGFREDIPGVHESELMIVEFTDGSILAIDTGTNALNIASDVEGVRPEDFHVSLDLHWVPEEQGPSTKQES